MYYAFLIAFSNLLPERQIKYILYGDFECQITITLL